MAETLSLTKQALVALQKMQVELDAMKQSRTEPIAIIGMGCRFPGGGKDPEAFWQGLEAGVDAVSQVPSDRWPVDGVVGSDSSLRAVRWGAFLDDVTGFDAAFFGISPREAEKLDPQQRLLLEVTWEALENAGILPERLVASRTGVFVGITGNDYAGLCSMLLPEQQDVYVATGNGHCFPPGRIAYTLGLQGPAIAVDTACSSSLVAVHLACQALRNAECELALVGGVNLMLSPATTALTARTQALSPTGRCKTFDASANGFVRGEGCGVVVLKRLSDATRDGDPILALLRGSAVNQDGRSAGLTAPNVLAQQAMLRQALQNAGVESADIGFVECHGTGTPLGDPIELEALLDILGKGRSASSPCALGAVKTNIGHLEAAAGIAGLIKTVMALKCEAIPRNLHFKLLNPRIQIGGAPFVIPTSTLAWPRGIRPRRAGVSAFGMSGTNVHVVVEESPAVAPVATVPERPAELIVLSAKTPTALTVQATRLSAHLSTHPEHGLSDTAYSLATTRTAMDHRVAISANSRAALLDALALVSQGQTPSGASRGTAATSTCKLAFLFTGQGAQVPGMGRGLHAAFPVFREAFERCERLFDAELDRPLRSIMWSNDGSSEAALLNRTEYTQPALFVLEYALHALWRSWGVEPDLLAGHSIGEIVAALVAGVFSVEDAVRLVAVRGRLMGELPAGGAMAVIGAQEAVVAAAISSQTDTVSIAAVNGPDQVVIAGAAPAVSAISGHFAARGVRTKALRVSHAFHSPLMEPILQDFARVAESITYHRPSLPLVSNLTGALFGDEATNPEYWVKHVRQAVRFADGIGVLHNAGANMFLELGPNPALLGLLPTCLPGQETTLLASLRAGKEDVRCMLEALGGYWVAGGSVDWKGVFPAGGMRLALPTYPWQRDRYWVKFHDAKTQAGEDSGHPLLGARVPTAAADAVFESVLGLASHSWLGDHRVAGQVFVPGAALAEIVHSAIECATLGPPLLRVTGLVLQSPLVLPEQGSRRVQVVVGKATGQARTAHVYSQPVEGGSGAAWTLHASASLVQQNAAPPSASLDLASLRTRCKEEMDVDALYRHAADLGLAYGAAFRCLRSLWRGHREAIAELALPTSVTSEGYTVHPVILDAAFQAVFAAAANVEAPSELLVPFEVGAFTVQEPTADVAWSYVSLQDESANTSIIADVTLLDGTGKVVAEVRSLRLQQVDRNQLKQHSHEALSDAFYRLDWQEARAPTAPERKLDGSWVVVAASGSEIAAKLSERLAPCVVTDPSGLRLVLSETASIAGVVCLWDAKTDESAPVAAQRNAIDGLSVVHAVSDHSISRLWWVTAGTATGAPADRISASSATVWGLGRTVAHEYPELGCTLIDVEPSAEGLDLLVRELMADDGSQSPQRENQISIRAGRRRVTRLVRAERLAESQGTMPTEGTVLITGGLGALGMHVARWLAGQGVPHLLLTSRRGMDSPGATQALAELTALGARATVAAADVTNQDELEAALRAIPEQWPLKGVIHAAGVLDDGVLAEQTADRFAKVLSPKIDGAFNLHRLTEKRTLDFFVLFSSMAATLGSAGQGSYAAANAFLDALAAERRAKGMPGQSLAWGPWSEGGMAAKLGKEQQARLEQRGAKRLSSEEGVVLLSRALGRPEDHLGVAMFDLEAVGHAFGGIVPPVWRALLRVPLTRATAETSDTWGRRFSTIPPERRLHEMRAAVQSEVARVLSLGGPGKVPMNRPLQELGLDSLMAVELRNAIGQRVGKSLPATLAFDYPTIEALSRWLLDEVVVPKSENSTMDESHLSEAEIRRALAAIPVAELRRANLLSKLLELAQRAPDVRPVGNSSFASIDAMDVDELISRFGNEPGSAGPTMGSSND